MWLMHERPRIRTIIRFIAIILFRIEALFNRHLMDVGMDLHHTWDSVIRLIIPLPL